MILARLATAGCAAALLSCGPAAPEPVHPPAPAPAPAPTRSEPVAPHEVQPTVPAVAIDVLIRVDEFAIGGGAHDDMVWPQLQKRWPKMEGCYQVALRGVEDPSKLPTQIVIDVTFRGRKVSELQIFDDERNELHGGLADCLLRVARELELTTDPDPGGNPGFALTLLLYPDEAKAPPLEKRDSWDGVSIGPDGSCFYTRRFPCAPGKHCRSPQTHRVACPPGNGRDEVWKVWRARHPGPLNRAGALGLVRAARSITSVQLLDADRASELGWIPESKLPELRKWLGKATPSTSIAATSAAWNVALFIRTKSRGSYLAFVNGAGNLLVDQLVPTRFMKMPRKGLAEISRGPDDDLVWQLLEDRFGPTRKKEYQTVPPPTPLGP